MPNLNSVLKSEITRLARKEIKGVVDPLRKANTAHRREIAELKRKLASLQREVASGARASKASKAAAATDAQPTKTRFAPGGVKSLRARLGLSATDLGRLIGVSGQSVYNWEAGKTVPRDGQKAVLVSLRGLGKRDAARRLEAMG